MKGEQLVTWGLSVTTLLAIAGIDHPAQAVPSSPPILAATPQTPATVSYLFVHPALGNDGSGDGSQQAPVRTITQALRIAHPGTVILLAPGTYSTVTGETFPIQLKPSVSLQGDPQQQGQNTVIVGGGYYLSPTAARQNITVLGATGSTLSGVTITNSNPRGYGLWIESASPTVLNNTFTANTHDGISVTGNGAPIIRANVFRRNGANGITVYGTSRAEIRENTFEQTGFAINVVEKAAPRIIGNRITQNKDGIVVQAQAQPVLRNNSIWGNSRDGLVAIADARPNLGTSSDPGGNLFSNNGRFDLNTQASSQTIAAVGNQLTSDRIRGRISLNGSGSPARPPVTAVTPTATPNPPVRSVAVLTPTPPSDPVVVLSRNNPSFVQVAPPRQAIAPPVTPPPLKRPPQIAVSQPPQLNRVPQSVAQPKPTPTAVGADAIIIPVPPPASPLVQRSLPVRSTPVRPTSVKRAALPAPSSTIPVLVPPTNLVRTPAGARVKSPGLLPVPSASIPGGGSGQNFPPPPTFALATNIRYRVIVDTTDAAQQAQVRSLIPTAFSTVSQGRRVLQVGAFGDRTKANELLQLLTSNGIPAVMEEL